MNKKTKFNIIGGLIFAAVIVVFIAKNIIDSYSLNKNSKFTIGTIAKIEPNIKSGFKITFYYKIQGKKYVAFGGIYKKNNELIGRRFYVQYSSTNPKNCKILLEKPVPDEIKQAPFEGWERIPK